MTHRVSIARVCTFLAVGYLIIPPASAQYIVTELEGLINARALNNAGQAIGNNFTMALLWDDGVVTELGTLGGTQSAAAAINNLGQIVGSSSITQTDPASGAQLQRPFLWLPAPAYGRSAGMHNLGTLGGTYHSSASDLNALGQIVGQSRPAGGAYPHGFRWQNGVMTDLGTLSSYSVANGINELGQIVGWSYDASIAQRAILWSGGQMIDLGTLGGFAFGANPASEALDINDSGQIAGQSHAAPHPGESSRHVFFWEGGQISNINLQAGILRDSYPRAINQAGDLLWESDVHGPVLSKDGRPIVLSRAIAGSGWTLSRAVDINDYGQILVWAKDAAGASGSVLLTPDCNRNDVSDREEVLSGAAPDVNANRVPDACDRDCNANGTPDDFDVAGGNSSDVNGNSIPDECHEFADCNTNGEFDYLDLASGLSEDRDADGVLDECEPRRVFHVDAAAGGATPPEGTAGNPFGTIQQAIDAALSGDEIVIAAGVYSGPGNRDLHTDGKALTIRSTDPADAESVAGTIIDPQLGGRAFVFDGGATAGTVLDGLTLRNGKPVAVALPFASRGGAVYAHNSDLTIRRCILTDNSAGRGGAICVEYGNVVISGCTFSGNNNNASCYECGGAAMSIDLYSSAIVEDCQITNNVGTAIQVLDYASLTLRDSVISGHDGFEGGALSSAGGLSTVTNCTISGNSASNGGGVFGQVVMTDCLLVGNTAGSRGGGAYAPAGSPSFIRCTFEDNHANAEGGGLFGSGTLTDCTFLGNTAYNGGGLSIGSASLTGCVIRDNESGGNGAGLRITGAVDLLNCAIVGNRAIQAAASGGGIDFSWVAAPLTMTHCLIAGNSAYFGGGLHALGSTGAFMLTNCTLTANTASSPSWQTGDGLYLNQTHAPHVLVNTLLWNNSAAGGREAYLRDASLTVRHSDVRNGPAAFTVAGPPHPPSSLIWGPGNIDAYPIFVDPLAGDYRLAAGSPCIDAADNTAVAADVLLDLGGDPRFHDDPGKPDTGNPDGLRPLVDVGAFEFQGTSFAPGDADGDGDFDLTDHARFTNCLSGPEGWPSPPDPSTAAECQGLFDFDHDADVDLADAAAFHLLFESL